MPDELITFLAAMTPIGELRASIPLGLVKFNLPWLLVFWLSVVGNLVPVPFILLFLGRAGPWLERMSNPMGSLLRWRTRQVRSRYGSLANRYGLMTVVLLVAIPLPLTGAWTGSLAIWALHIPIRQGLGGITIGVFVAGTIVTALVLAGKETLAGLR
jgi:uncharacterized membrane protein